MTTEPLSIALSAAFAVGLIVSVVTLAWVWAVWYMIGHHAKLNARAQEHYAKLMTQVLAMLETHKTRVWAQDTATATIRAGSDGESVAHAAWLASQFGAPPASVAPAGGRTHSEILNDSYAFADENELARHGS